MLRGDGRPAEDGRVRSDVLGRAGRVEQREAEAGGGSTVGSDALGAEPEQEGLDVLVIDPDATLTVRAVHAAIHRDDVYAANGVAGLPADLRHLNERSAVHEAERLTSASASDHGLVGSETDAFGSHLVDVRTHGGRVLEQFLGGRE